MKRQKVRWTELRPDDFLVRQKACSIVYLPMGLCEPHGHIAALGLDTIKADYYCEESARRAGGIVAPTQGYHIHESGFHARWLEDVVGEENPRLGGMPPHVVCRHFLYQLRAFANAGFTAVVVVSGHSGGSQEDLRLFAREFSERIGIPVTVKSDPEWIAGQYDADHAGRYEISQLMAIDPELVDLSLINRQHDANSGGRLALGGNAGEATAEFGHAINEAIVQAIVASVRELISRPNSGPLEQPVGYDILESDGARRVWMKAVAGQGGEEQFQRRCFEMGVVAPRVAHRQDARL